MMNLTQLLRDRFEIDRHPLRLVNSEPMPGPTGTRVTRLGFENAAGEPVRAIFCQPAQPSGPAPAVLVIHAHGGRYEIGADELMHGRPSLDAPLGPALAKIGIQSLCLDMPCFGERAHVTEPVLSKALLWEGRSLAGQMLGESAAAFAWLADQDCVSADRVGIFGLSMGATLGYWLSAVELRVRALVHLCCLADFRCLIESGTHDLHGPYLTIPGLLPLAGNGEIAGLVAPRAQFIGLGDLDPLTPPDAADRALFEVRRAYERAGGRLVVHREALAGHQETPAMRAAVLAFLESELGSG